MSHNYDIAVLGAGVFGLVTARRLAERGRSVVVLDRSPVGTEASGFALGRLDPLLRGSGSAFRPASEHEPAGEIGKSAGEAEIGLAGFRLHHALEEEIQSISGIDYQSDEQPTLQFLTSEADRESGLQSAADWANGGFPSEALDPDGMRALDNRLSPSEYGGLLVHGPYFIDSLRFVQALAAWATEGGAVLQTANVSDVTAAGDSAVVETSAGTYSAEHVVIALGPWSGEFSRRLGVEIPVVPSKGEILRMTPPPGEPIAMHLHGGCSVVHKKDGHVWVAATAAEDGFNREPTEWAERRLLDYASEMLPVMADSKILTHTVCFRPSSTDGLPVLGRLPVDAPVWVASGGGGSGIMQSLLVGDQMAEMIEQGNGDPATGAMALSRFD